MLIRMLVGLSGPAYTLSPGDERDFPQDEAVRLINASYAVPVSEREIETTDARQAQEVRRRGRPRKHD